MTEERTVPDHAGLPVHSRARGRPGSRTPWRRRRGARPARRGSTSNGSPVRSMSTSSAVISTDGSWGPPVPSVRLVCRGRPRQPAARLERGEARAARPRGARPRRAGGRPRRRGRGRRATRSCVASASTQATRSATPCVSSGQPAPLVQTDLGEVDRRRRSSRAGPARSRCGPRRRRRRAPGRATGRRTPRRRTGWARPTRRARRRRTARPIRAASMPLSLAARPTSGSGRRPTAGRPSARRIRTSQAGASESIAERGGRLDVGPGEVRPTTVTDASRVGATPVRASTTCAPRCARPEVATAPRPERDDGATRVGSVRVLDADPPVGPAGVGHVHDHVAAGREAEVGVVEAAERRRCPLHRPALHHAAGVEHAPSAGPTSKAPPDALRARSPMAAPRRPPGGSRRPTSPRASRETTESGR